MNVYNRFPRGSEWRKWDLHVHSPASFHWNGGKHLSQMSTDDRHASLRQMFDAIESSDVAAFAITDYWTFDGYLAFSQFLTEKSLKLTKGVFPGMELRIEAPTDFRLNMQVVLSDKLSEQELQDFMHTLKIGSKPARSLSSEALAEFARTLDASKAKVYGFEAPESLSTEQLVALGCKTVEITKESLTQAIHEVGETRAIIVMPYSTSDGLKKLDWKKHPQADNYFMQTANVFESRDDETMNLFLGIETETNREIIGNRGGCGKSDRSLRWI